MQIAANEYCQSNASAVFGVRQRAQSAIDAEIDANNVISINEHSGPPFSVVVWYPAKKL